jgi:phosphate transport system protein
MERHFDEELAALKRQLLRMGALAEVMLKDAVAALVQRDSTRLEPVFSREDQINRLQMEIDEDVLRLIALHQPTASDLRFLLGASRIGGDLERIGDQAINIAETVTRLLQVPPITPFDIIPRLADSAAGMVSAALHAFVNGDATRARLVLQRDDEVDAMRDAVIEKMLGLMRADVENIERGLRLVSVGRQLERIADHATNIAEDVIFVAEGKDVRHHAEDRPDHA